jgi:hypothetical protein
MSIQLSDDFLGWADQWLRPIATREIHSFLVNHKHWMLLAVDGKNWVLLLFDMAEKSGSCPSADTPVFVVAPGQTTLEITARELSEDSRWWLTPDSGVHFEDWEIDLSDLFKCDAAQWYRQCVVYEDGPHDEDYSHLPVEHWDGMLSKPRASGIEEAGDLITLCVNGYDWGGWGGWGAQVDGQGYLWVTAPGWRRFLGQPDDLNEAVQEATDEIEMALLDLSTESEKFFAEQGGELFSGVLDPRQMLTVAEALLPSQDYVDEVGGEEWEISCVGFEGSLNDLRALVEGS